MKLIKIALLSALLILSTLSSLSAVHIWEDNYQTLLQTSDPIHIDGNQALIDYVSSNGLQGDGSKDNPYLIQDLELEAFGDYQIHIQNTNLFLVLSGLSVKNGISGGIRIEHASNVVIENSLIDNNFGDGVFVINSEDIVIKENTIINTKSKAPFQRSDGRWDFPFAIDVTRANRVEIYNNTVQDTVDGIWIWDYVNNSIIDGNYVENSEFDGIGHGGPGQTSVNNTITNNYIENARYGIWTIAGADLLVDQNVIRKTEQGIRVEYTIRGTYTKNSVLDNVHGMIVRNLAVNSKISYNLFQDNFYYGLDIDDKITTVDNNAFINNNNGKIQANGRSSVNIIVRSNFYSDLEPVDEDNDSIGDNEYTWDGTVQLIDNSPSLSPSDLVPNEYLDYENTWMSKTTESDQNVLSFNFGIWMVITGILIGFEMKRNRSKRGDFM